MAIKVGGTTVVDDSRAISNVTTITATTLNGNVSATGAVSAASVTATGTISATTFTGSGSGLTGVATTGKAIAMALVFGG